MKNLKYTIIGMFAFLANCNVLLAQLSGDEVFLQGKYIEIGIDNCGIFGSDGTGNIPATGAQGTTYHENDFNGLGFVADPDKDGWAAGSPAQCGDFFTPGAPASGFNLAYSPNGGACVNLDNENSCTACELPGSHTAYSYDGITGNLSTTWEGSSAAGVDISQTTNLNEEDLFFTVSIQICNNTATVMEDVIYITSLDPDNDQPVCGSFVTTNTPVNDPATCSAYVSATGNCIGCFMAYGTKDPRASAYTGAFCTPSTACSTACGVGGINCTTSTTSDIGMGLFFELGDIPIGGCVTFSYAVVLDIDDLDLGLAATVSLTANGMNVPIDATGNSSIENCGTNSYDLTIPSGVYNWVWSPATGLSATTGSMVTATVTSPITYTITGTPISGACAIPTSFMLSFPAPANCAGATCEALPSIICPEDAFVCADPGGTTATDIPDIDLEPCEVMGIDCSMAPDPIVYIASVEGAGDGSCTTAGEYIEICVAACAGCTGTVDLAGYEIEDSASNDGSPETSINITAGTLQYGECLTIYSGYLNGDITNPAMGTMGSAVTIGSDRGACTIWNNSTDVAFLYDGDSQGAGTLLDQENSNGGLSTYTVPTITGCSECANTFVDGTFTDNTFFSGSETLINFDDITVGPSQFFPTVGNEYASMGLTLGAGLSITTDEFGTGVPYPTAPNGLFNGVSVSPPWIPIELNFDTPQNRIGFELFTNPGTSTVNLICSLAGTVVGTETFSTTLAFSYIGLESAAGFDKIEIVAPSNGAMRVDDLSFEACPSTTMVATEPGTYCDDCPDDVMITYELTGATVAGPIMGTDAGVETYNAGLTVVEYCIDDGINPEVCCTFDVFVAAIEYEIDAVCEPCGTATVTISAIAEGYPAYVAATGMDPLMDALYTITGSYESSVNGNCSIDECTGGAENSMTPDDIVTTTLAAATTAPEGGMLVLSNVAGTVDLTITDAIGCEVDVAFEWEVPTIDVEACELKVCQFNNTDITTGCPVENILEDCLTGTIVANSCSLIEIEINPDDFPGEISYEITSNTSGLVVDAGDFTGLPIDETTVVETGCLDETDTYSITFFDSFGDGWSCPGTDVVEVVVNGVTINVADWTAVSGCGSGDTPNGDGTTYGPFDVGAPAGMAEVFGMFTGPGVVDNGDNTGDFNATAAGPGLHVINFDYTDPETGCVLHAETQIHVCANPDDPIPVDDDLMFCSDFGIPTLQVVSGGAGIAGSFTVVAPSDNFPNETYWEITSGGAVVATGSAGTVVTCNLPITANYSITFYDLSGDGWSCGDAVGTQVVDTESGAALFTYSAGAWVGNTCGDKLNFNFPNGNGAQFGPFPLGSPTPNNDPGTADNFLWFGPSATPPTVLDDGSHIGEGACFNPAAFFPSDLCPQTFWVVAVNTDDYDACGELFTGLPVAGTLSCFSCPVPVMITEFDTPAAPKVTNNFFCIGKNPGTAPLMAECGDCEFCPTDPAPTTSITWYDIEGNQVGTGPTFDPFTAGVIDPTTCTPGCITFFATCTCSGDIDCESIKMPVVYEILECDDDCLDGCTYFLVLEDSGCDGWDGASLDLSINEVWPATNYKLSYSSCHPGFDVIPFEVTDGALIDVAYWNGANETEHAWKILDWNRNIVAQSGYDAMGCNTTVPTLALDGTERFKAECPECCEEEIEEFCARVTMGTWPEFMSWELYEGTCSIDKQGPRVFYINATTYEGNPPGSVVDHEIPNLDGCQEYTIALFDGFNTGWFGGDWTLLTSNKCYGPVGNQILDESDSKFGWYTVIGVTDTEFPNDNNANLPGDEFRKCFQLPCCSECPEEFTQLVTPDPATCLGAAINVPMPKAKICYPNCSHAQGCDVVVDVELLVNGDPFGGIYFDTNFEPGSNATLNNLPVGCHKLVYYIEYCDDITTRCTSDFTIFTDPNPTMVCNDLVHITLNNNNDNPAEGGWNQGFNDDLGECVIKVTPDMVLENLFAEQCQTTINSEYRITILDTDGAPLVVTSDRGLPLDCQGREIPAALLNCPLVPAHNLISSAQVKQTFTYVIEHKLSGNKCWGEIKVEDKDAPLIICNDYDVECTNPDYANEDFEVIDTITAGPELPANIAGGFGGPGQSNLYLPVNIGVDKCYPLGVKLKDIQVNLDMIHNEITDVSVFLHLPTALINAGFTSPMTLDLNGDVGSQNTYTPNPVNDSPDLMNFVSGPLANPDCNLLVSTSPENFATETTGATSLPGNLGGTWYIQIVDNGVSFPDPPFGAGEVTAANIIITCGFPTPVAAYDCSPFELSLIAEIIEETNCDQSDWNGAKLLRTYEAIDECGNASYCTQTVNLKAPSFNDISIPGDIDLECSDETCDPENITPDLSGSPFFGCFNVTAELHGFCDVSYTYNDQIIPTCGKGYKLVREWTIVNCCTNVFKNFTQLIGVGDHTGPEINAGDITANSHPYDCDASLVFSQAVTDVCSGVATISVSYTVGGGAYTGGGTVNIANIFPGGDSVDNLPLGITEVMITATDSCNNPTTQLVNVTIEDNSQPFAVCDDDLHVSLNNDGLAWIAAESFDEGSSDNCSEVTLEIRSLGCMGEDWGPAAEVACCDIPNVVLELRVTDAAGNTNICWAEITIEDPSEPTVTCPDDRTVDCNDPLFNNPWQEEPVAEDNCAVDLIDTVDGGSLDNCHAGTLTRTWTYSDGSDKSDDVSCTQRITFEHVSDFTVQFPPDITIDTCPDDTGDTGAPIILDDDCELVAINYEDQLLGLGNNGDDDASCFKILRKWTLINWCVYDDTQTPTDGGIPLPLPNTFRDDDGYFYYVQTIKVIDEEAPTVDMDIPDPCDFTDECAGTAVLIAVGSDDCSTELEYNYTVDAFSDGTIDFAGDGEDASGFYDYGCHIITWNVGDNCGNWTTADFEFCVEDCKNPTPVCKNGISVEVMNDGDGCVPIWATDLLEYAFDNCDEDEAVEATVLIRRAGETGPPQTQIEVCCDDVPAGNVNVEIWVTDAAGNSDFCATYIIPQDNLGNCPGSGGGSSTIQGDIVTQDYEDVDQVMVDINGTAVENNISGSYNFSSLQTGSSYTISPEKKIKPLNGVSTYDLVLISQHIIGTTPLTSPYQLIAADVNKSGSVTTFDMVQLRQLILFVIDDFPNNNSWRFVDMDYVFPVPTNPWSETFPEVINVASLPASGELLADFFAVKIGDINGSANPNTLLGTNDREMPTTLVLNVDDREMVAGETYTVDFLANDFTNISGYQFTMNFDRSVVEFVGTKAGALNVSDKNFGTSLLDEGVITTSYNEATAMTLGNEEKLFSITFTAKANAFLNDVIGINSKYTQAEAYSGDGELKEIAIGFNTANGTIIAGGTFELLQNKPNPFNESTVIGFNLPEATAATLKVYDVSGKMLRIIEGDFARGYNEVTIERGELQTTGVLYYQLDTEEDSATKKMIILD